MYHVDPQLFKTLAQTLCPQALESLTQAQSQGECGWDILVDEGWVHPKVLLPYVAQHLGLAVCHDFTLQDCPKEVAQHISPSFAKHYQVLPWKQEGSHIWLLVGDFLSHARMDEVRFALGVPIIWALTTPQIFKRAWGHYCLEAIPPSSQAFQDEIVSDTSVTQSNIHHWLKHILATALAAHCLDIHFELHHEQLAVRVRQPQGLKVLDTVNAQQGRAALTRLKLFAGIDIAQMFLPQEGRFAASVLGLGAAEFRVSSLPIAQGESLVLRVLRPDIPARGLESLGLGTQLLSTVWNALETQEGLFIFTGPTGSGKTTTVYALLSKLNQMHHKLATVEDPVEYTLEGALQLQVQESIGLGFADGLKALLRHDPDIILVGEIRDSQTAHMAVQAALTGHRVLATLHTPDPVSAIMRLIDLGVAPYLVAATLKGVLAQRLMWGMADANHPQHALTAHFSWLSIHPQLQSLIASASSLEPMRQCIDALNLLHTNT